MKAWVLHGINDIRFEDVDRPRPSEDGVVVAVKAAGVCGSDIPRIYRTGAHVHPLIPGHEFSGAVVETGRNVGAEWMNKRVGIFPLIPCMDCVACRKRRYELCRNYSYLGSRRDGGFAEYVPVPEWNLIALPDSVSYGQAAMLEPMAVAVHAMRRSALEKNGTVAILGLGTIGLLLLMFLMDAGVQDVIAVGNKEIQQGKALQLGLKEDRYCDSRKQDVSKWILEQTGGKGAEVFFECVGRNETVSLAVDLSAPEGCVCLVGNPYSDMALEKNVYWKILRNQLTVKGVWNSSFTHEDGDDWHYALERLALKKIAPETMISHRYRLHEAEQGLLAMQKKGACIKVMFDV